jgi:hypothetical protein
MASGVTKIADVVVPSIFTPYVQQITEEKSRLVQSGIMSVDPAVSALLAGGGLTFNVPSFKDLDNDDENISTDDETSDATPNKIGTATEVAVRLNRNQSWSSMDLTAALAGADPMAAIASRVGEYWARRLQAAAIATMKGVLLDNTANFSGDYTNDISGASFVAGVTDFSAEAFLDAAVTMGDSQEDLVGVIIHSVVYNRMQKNNLIDFIPDSQGNITIPTFLGRRVIVDDGMPVTAGVYDSWLFGPGAMRLGMASPDTPTEVDRKPAAGDGGGQDVLHSRVQWAIHPVGHAYTGTAPNGGPSNAATTNNLAIATSWNRVFSERKQIKFARLITRES